KPNEIPAPKL
ncbi:hypothetical protein D030_5478B, partial [Vibrio parahaemolyticus AQ3810]